MTVKTDNHNPKAKLDLRRYFLAKYHADGSARVLDCCQGGGRLWKALREEFAVESYWGLDLKPKAGRLNLDSVRVLTQPGWPQDVVDVDTYGSPWKHWAALIPNVQRPTTVFLTIGQLTTGTVGSLGNAALGAMGLGSLSRSLPMAFHVKIAKHVVSYGLARCCESGITLIEAVEAVSDGNARYIAVRLEKRRPDADNIRPPAQSKLKGFEPCKTSLPAERSS